MFERERETPPVVCCSHLLNDVDRSHAVSRVGARENPPQERAPTSVAYAENQSMFLDSLCDDAAWLGRYAKSRNGEVMPFELMEQAILAKFPYKVRKGVCGGVKRDSEEKPEPSPPVHLLFVPPDKPIPSLPLYINPDPSLPRKRV